MPFAYSLPIFVWNCPVLPVMPWVITLVFLLTRMLISRRQCINVSGYSRRPSLSPGGRDDLLRRVGHIVPGNDRQARLGEYLLADLHVGSLEPDHQRHVELDL